MSPCPTNKRGKHSICCVMPDSDSKPILLFCSWCGQTTRQVMDLPTPMDDLPSDAIEQIARNRGK